MKRNFVAIALAIFGTVCVAGPFQGRLVGQQPPRATVYEGARLIDGNGGPAIENAAFVVADGKFTQVGRAGQLSPPADAAHVDLTGKTVMPALIDAHVHLGYRRGTTFTADNFTRENIADQLRQFSHWGVSGVLSTGTDIGDLIFQMRNGTRSPNYRGTIIRTAWRGIAPPDAGPFPPMRSAPFGVRTEEEARADVRELAERKVDLVKIWVDDRGGTLPKLSPAISRAVIGCLASSVKLSRPSAASSARIRRLVWSTPSTYSPARRQRSADHHPLYLVGALDDLQRLGLAHEPLSREVLDVTVTAEHLHRVGGRLHRRIGGEKLGHRGLRTVGQAGILAPRRR